MTQEPIEIPVFLFACLAIGTIIATISSARIIWVLGFTSARVRALLATALQGYREQNLSVLNDALGKLSTRCPESGLQIFIRKGTNTSLTTFPAATQTAATKFDLILFRTRQSMALIGHTIVALILAFLWDITRTIKATLTGISMERNTETWVLAERANEVLRTAVPAIVFIALLYGLYCVFQFRLNARQAYWENMIQQVRSITDHKFPGLARGAGGPDDKP